MATWRASVNAHIRQNKRLLRAYSKEGGGQFEEFERDERHPGDTGDESDRNGRDNEHVTHDVRSSDLGGSRPHVPDPEDAAGFLALT